MLADFDKMSENARIWIYQSDRAMSAEEQAKAKAEVSGFLSQWAAHGSALQASGEVMHDHFLIICIDESFQMASGCSIDSSVRFVQELGQKQGIDFFKRTNLAFWINDKVELLPMSEMKNKVASGQITASTLFFDNSQQAKGQLSSSWQKAAGETWLKRYFKPALSV